MKLRRRHSGFTLIEVLVTFVIIAIGLLGLGALQVNTMNNSFDTHQRALVASMVEDMTARIRMNASAARAGDYFTGRPDSTDCAEMMGAQRDLCEWYAQIDGSSASMLSEDVSGAEGQRNIGAPLGARGCIVPLSSSGSGELWVRVSVAWVGITPQSQAAASCGADDMGDEAYRRVVFRDVAVR